MKALVKEALGHGNLHVVERPEPEAGIGQVKIKVQLAGICGSDMHTYEGKYKVAAPVTLGHEFGGEIVAVGEGVTEFKIGDRVTSETTFYVCGKCRFCQTKDYNLCSSRKGLGTQVDGAFAQYVIARQESVHRLPDNVSFLAASMTEAVACAYHAVLTGSVKAGDVVVVLGPGPIGMLVAQIAKYFGAKVVITGLAKDEPRLKKTLECGIDAAINIQAEDINQVVTSMTDGYGADVVIECSGAPVSVNMGLDLLRKQGVFVQVGIFPITDVPTDFEKITQKEIRVFGSRSQKPSDWEPTLDLMNRGAVQAEALVSHQFMIAEWDKAYEVIKKGEAIKVVLSPIG